MQMFLITRFFSPFKKLTYCRQLANAASSPGCWSVIVGQDEMCAIRKCPYAMQASDRYLLVSSRSKKLHHPARSLCGGDFWSWQSKKGLWQKINALEITIWGPETTYTVRTTGDRLSATGLNNKQVFKVDHKSTPCVDAPEYTSTLGGNEKERTYVSIYYHCRHWRNGGPCWARTSDQLVKSQLLYQLS